MWARDLQARLYEQLIQSIEHLSSLSKEKLLAGALNVLDKFTDHRAVLKSEEKPGLIRSRSQDGLSTQLLLNEAKLLRYIERMKRECNVDFDYFYRKIQSKFSKFLDSKSGTRHFLHNFIDLANKVRCIPQQLICGQSFWAIVKEVDTFKRDLLEYKETYLRKYNPKSTVDFKTLENLVEVFVYIVFKMGRLISYQYAIIGKAITCDSLPSEVVKPPSKSTFKTEAQKIKEIREQFEHAKSNSSKSVRTSSSESVSSGVTQQNSGQQGDFTALFKDFKAKEEQSNPLACLLLHLQETQNNEYKDALRGTIESITDSKDPLFEPVYNKEKVKRLEKHLFSFIEKEKPPPSIVCRICEERVPALNEEDHTSFCSQRQNVLQTLGQEVADKLFKIYKELSDLVAQNRTQNKSRNQVNKRALQRSGSMMESKSHYFENKQKLLRKVTQNQRSIERSMSRQIPTKKSIDAPTPDTFQSSDTSVAQRQLFQISPLKKDLKLDNKKVRNVTTGKMKRDMLKIAAQKKKNNERLNLSSSSSVLRSKFHRPQIKTSQQHVELKRLLFVKKMSEQTSPKKEVKRKEHPGLKIVINPFDGNSENSKEDSAHIGINSGGESLSLMEDSKENQEKQNREKNIIISKLDFISPRRNLSARSLEGTPVSPRDMEWEEVAEKSGLNSARRKSMLLRHCNSLEQSSAGGVFTEELHRDIMNEELKQEVLEDGKSKIINSRIKVPQFLNLGDINAKPRRNSYNPNVEEFLDDMMGDGMRSESMSNVNKLRERVASSSRGKNTSEMSENNSLEELFDHLNPTQFNSSIDEGSLSHRSRLRLPKPSSFLGDDLNSKRDSHRDELYSSATSDDWNDSVYNALEVQNMIEEAGQRKNEEDMKSPAERRLSHFALSNKSISMKIPDSLPKRVMESSRDERSSFKNSSADKDSSKEDDPKSEEEPQQQTELKSSRGEIRMTRKSQFQLEKEKSNQKLQNPAKKRSAVKIDPQKTFADEKKWDEQKSANIVKPFIQSFKPLRKLKRYKEPAKVLQTQSSKESTHKEEIPVDQRKKSSKKKTKGSGKAEEILKKLSKKYSEEAEKEVEQKAPQEEKVEIELEENSSPHATESDSEDGYKEETPKREEEKFSAYMIHTRTRASLESKQRGSIESKQRDSIESRAKGSLAQYYKTMSSLGTADSDNSYPHRNLRSLGSGIIQKSSCTLQALAQLTEIAKQQYSVPLTKETLAYDLEDSIQKLDSYIKKCEFTAKELEVVEKFKQGLEAKQELVRNLHSLEQKLSQTSNPEYYWRKTNQNKTYIRKLEPGDSSVRRGSILMPMRRGSTRAAIVRSESGNIDKRLGAGRRQSVQINFSKLSEAVQNKQNNSSSGSKHSTHSRTPSRKTSATNLVVSDCSTPAQMKSLIESGEGTRSNSVQSSNGQEKPRVRGEKKKSYFAHDPEGAISSSHNRRVQQLMMQECSSQNSTSYVRKDLTVVSEEAKNSSGVDRRYNLHGSFEDGRGYAHLSDDSSHNQNKTCSNLRQLNISVSNDDSLSCSSPNNSQLLHLSPSHLQGRASLFSKHSEHQSVEYLSCTSKKSITHSREPSDCGSHMLHEGVSDSESVAMEGIKLGLNGLKFSKNGISRNNPNLDESITNSEGQSSVSMIKGEDNVYSEGPNLFSMNSGTFNLIITGATGTPKSGMNNEIKLPSHQNFDDDDSFQESDISFGGSSEKDSDNELKNRYNITRTMCPAQGKELSPFLNTNEEERVTDNLPSTNYLQPSTLGLLPGPSAWLSRKLTAISEARTETSQYRHFCHSKTLRFEAATNNAPVKAEDAKSMPDLSMSHCEQQHIVSFGELSDGAQSDHIIDFSHFVLKSMEFFGEDTDVGGPFYSRRILLNRQTAGSSSRESIISDEDLLGFSNEEEFKYMKEDNSHEERRLRKHSSRKFWEKRLKKCRRNIMAVQNKSMLFSRHKTLGGHDFEHIEESDEDEEMSQASEGESVTSYRHIERCHSMEFTPSMLNSVRNMDPSAPSKVTIKDFQILKRLSKGAYGYVVLAEKKTSKDLFAVKIMNVNEVVKKNQIDLLSVEKEILNTVNSDFVVHGAYSFKDQNFLYIAMEYLPGGDLAALLQNELRFEFYEAKFYLKEIVQALQYLREMEYVHRDLKPDNILLDRFGHLKLTDFGLSRAGLLEKKDRLNKSNHDDSTQDLSPTASYVGSRKRSAAVSMAATMKKTHAQYKRILGTPNYMSPEVIEGKEHSYPVDYWSLGVMAYEIIVGALPFSGDTVDELFKNITAGNVEYPDIDDEVWPEETDDFVKRLLDPNPRTRLGSSDIQEIKDHAYFKGVNWEKDDLKPPYVPEVKDNKDFANQDRERLISDKSWNQILETIAGIGSPVKKAGKGGRGPNILGNLHPVEEEKDYRRGSEIKNWDSQNDEWLWALNKKEAKEKLTGFWKNRNPTLMDELNPSSSDTSTEMSKPKSVKRQNSLPQSTFSKMKHASSED